MEVKKTPLNTWHRENGGKMVDFAGWDMPVQFQGLRQEHQATREAVGLFDVSHMGEIRVKGPKSVESLQWMTTNDVSKLKVGQAQYTLLPNENGGLVDDLIVYCVEPGEDYLLCVNASNKDKDFAHIQKNNRGADITDESSYWGQIAVQGPKAIALIEQVLLPNFSEIPSFHFARFDFKGKSCLIARTGYTGEDGGEIFVPAEVTLSMWQALFDAGQSSGIQACGLGARDTLRTEARLPLYGHEIDDTTNPYSAGLGWVVKPKAKDFLGKEPMLAQKAQLTRKLVGFQLVEKGVPRQGYSLFSFDNKEIGRVTSGTMSPSLDIPIGIGYIEKTHAEIGTEFWVEIRNRKVKAKVVPTPFVSKSN